MTNFEEIVEYLFLKFTLDFNQIFQISILFSCIWVGLFYTFKAFISETKKLGWVISLINSAVTTIFGFSYLFYNLNRHKNFFFYGPDPNLIFYSVQNVEVIISIWFGSACIFDLLFGVIYYPKYLKLLTGYVHHTVFIWMMVFSCSGNGGFVKARPFTSAFVYMLIEELPTFLLSLGSIFPSCRTDLGFGITFLFLRIIYHFYIVTFAFISNFHTPGMCLYYATLGMHLLWFRDWTVSYSKTLKKANESKKN